MGYELQNGGTRRLAGYLLIGSLATALPLVGACGSQQDDGDDLGTIDSGGFVSGQVIVDWNQNALDNALQVDGYADPFIHERALTMMHLAMHDAANGVDRRFETYASSARDRRANPIAAAAEAAHGVLVAIYPGQSAFLGDRLAQSLAQVPNGSAKDRGIALGDAAAAAILQLRSADGSDQFGVYTPGNQPGDYQFTPGFDFVYRPAWQFVTPFGVESNSQFRSAPPPALTSATYARDYNEVKEYGRITGSTRTADEQFYADWWYEPAELTWNHIARVIWPGQRSIQDLWNSARLFALVNVGLMDGYLSGWESKQFYDSWRPITAIRAGDTDGNAATVPEATWDSYCVAPPLQDYPSTHSVLGAAAAEIMIRVLRRDVGFTMTTSSAKPPGATHTLSSLRRGALENADSRVGCGIHFRFATNAGLLMGRRIADEVVDEILEPN